MKVQRLSRKGVGLETVRNGEALKRVWYSLFPLKYLEREGIKVKPVHRRILFAMNDLKLYNNKPHTKSAKVIGEVLGSYHPHGI